MTPPSPPTFESVDSALRRAGAAADAAEADGSLCGLACVLGPSARSSWIAETLEQAETGAPATRACADLLGKLAEATCAALEEGDLSFQPLLPEEDAALATRAGCLGQWCQGFNHGFAVGARIGDAEEVLNEGPTGEIVRDFAEMARIAVPSSDPGDDGEAAYSELVEYLRVGVQLIYEELTPVRSRLAASGLH